MLHALQHPCIVSLIGISVHRSASALELAPLGSLNTVLSRNARGMRCTWSLPPGPCGPAGLGPREPAGAEGTAA